MCLCAGVGPVRAEAERRNRGGRRRQDGLRRPRSALPFFVAVSLCVRTHRISADPLEAGDQPSEQAQPGQQQAQAQAQGQATPSEQPAQEQEPSARSKLLPSADDEPRTRSPHTRARYDGEDDKERDKDEHEAEQHDEHEHEHEQAEDQDETRAQPSLPPLPAAFPADLLFLASSNKKGACFVETSSLDGETNLKTRVPVPPCQEHVRAHFVCNHSRWMLNAGVHRGPAHRDGAAAVAARDAQVRTAQRRNRLLQRSAFTSIQCSFIDRLCVKAR